MTALWCKFRFNYDYERLSNNIKCLTSHTPQWLIDYIVYVIKVYYLYIYT